MPRLVSHPDEVKIVSKRFGQGAADIDKYIELGGYEAAKKCLQQGRTPVRIFPVAHYRSWNINRDNRARACFVRLGFYRDCNCLCSHIICFLFMGN